jgi:SAM-dependent methyltransferase
MPSSDQQQPDSSSRSILGAPAVQALVIQVIAFAGVLGLTFGIPLLLKTQVTIAGAALLQGVIAVALARWRRMAAWWLIIHFLFPVALVVLLAVHWPSWIFLAGFLALLALYWNTFRTQVPYYPSNAQVRRVVAELLPRERAPRFIDIGSGLGGMVLGLADLRPEGRFTGIEIAPLPWLISRVRARLSRKSARFVRGDYEQLDFAAFDVVFAYLSPAAMPRLWRKAAAEMQPGALLLSYEFSIPDVAPHEVLYPIVDGPALYVWRF